MIASDIALCSDLRLLSRFISESIPSQIKYTPTLRELQVAQFLLLHLSEDQEHPILLTYPGEIALIRFLPNINTLSVGASKVMGEILNAIIVKIKEDQVRQMNKILNLF